MEGPAEVDAYIKAGPEMRTKMTSRNDITGDAIKTKIQEMTNKAYATGWDLIWAVNRPNQTQNQIDDPNNEEKIKLENRVTNE